MITVSQLWIYPFKSCRGLAIPSASFDKWGMCGDRRLMAVDKNGLFISARRYAPLLQITCQQNIGGWLLEHAEMGESCQIDRELLCEPIQGTLWKDTFSALDAGDEAADWLSSLLATNVRVVVWKEQSRYSNKYHFETTFSDASPLLVTTESSLIQACHWASINPDVRRFRPNIVLSGTAAFAEDSWKTFRIGNLVFEVLDTCTRCILTTRDPDTGELHPEKEPMKALKKYHANDDGLPIFGVNANLVGSIAEASISVGNEVHLSS